MTERREDPQPEPGEVTPTPEDEAAPDVAGQSTADPREQPTPDAAARATSDSAGEPSVEELADARPARLRHAPRFGRFIGTAVALGLLIGLILAIFIPPPQGVGLVLAWAYLGLPIALVLGLAAGFAAVVIDRRS